MLRAVLAAAMILMALPQPARAAEKAVATVNGKAILREDLVYELDRLRRQQGRGDEGEALERLIRRELLLQVAREAGFEASLAKVEEEMAGIRRTFVSPEAFARELSLLGLSEAAVRRQVEKGLAIAAYTEQRFLPQETVSEEELRVWYEGHPEAFRRPERVRASHILVRMEAGWDEGRRERARAKIAGLEKRLRKGEAFAGLARQFSECFSAPAGGDLGYFTRQEMETSFAVAAFALRPGEMSGVVESRHGFHLIQVTDIEPEAKISFAEAAPGLARRLREEKARGAAMRHAAELRAKAVVLMAPETGN